MKLALSIIALGLAIPVMVLEAQPIVFTPRQIADETAQTYQYRQQDLAQALQHCTSRWDPQPLAGAVALMMPRPQGGQQLYHFQRSEQMAPELAARYPQIQTYYGQSADNTGETIYLCVSPNRIKALYFSVAGMSHTLEPSYTDNNEYRFRSRAAWDRPPPIERNCYSEAPHTDEKYAGEGTSQGRRGNTQVYHYRLALSCTGEYAQYHGGSLLASLTAMNELLLQVNAIYERELSVHFNMAAGTDALIFLDPQSDPFDNDDRATLPVINSQLCNQQLGHRNFDLGMVLSTSFGGQALIGAACLGSRKAQAFAGLSKPEGYYLGTIVAHELAHLLGAQHTHSNDCNRNIRTAYEPGSGSTLMAYAGICAPDLQDLPDDYFHGHSLKVLSQKIRFGTMLGCVQSIPTDNHPPVVDAGPDLIIPLGQTFQLQGKAYDPDGDLLSYRWEQIDAWSDQEGMGPLWRSAVPTTSSLRAFGSINDPDWDPLPMQVRKARFRLTVRDHHRGLGTAVYDDIIVTFVEANSTFGPEPTNPTLPASPFTVDLYPNPTTDILTIRWDASPDRDIQIRMYNSRGDALPLLTRTSSMSNSRKIDLSSYPAGLYWIHLTSDDQIWTGAFVRR